MSLIHHSKRAITLRNPDPFDTEVIDAIREHALEAYPKECCGFVMPDGYMRVDNVHPEPTEFFRVDPLAAARAMEGGALAFVHSHPDGSPIPSLNDQLCQIEEGMTWGIVPVLGINEGDEVKPLAQPITWWGDDLPIPPLKGRKFIFGVFDCWRLYRHYMMLEHGITLPNFAYGEDFVEKNENVFVENCERAGLRNLGKIDMSRLHVGDMLIGHLRGEHPNHCGVYLGGDTFLHHAPGQASREDNLLRWWPHMDTVFRYDGLEETASLR